MTDPADSPLAFRRTGERGPPLVLLHGFAGNQSTWRFWVPDLSRDHQVFALDLKGFGDSPKPRDGRYSPHDHAALLDAWLDWAGLERITLVGHSLGGGVALLSALQQERSARRVERLVIVAGPAFPQPLPRFISLARVPLLGRVALGLLSPERVIRMALSSIVFDPAAVDEVWVHNYAEPLGRRGGRYGLLTSARQILPPDLDALTDRYPAMTLPTLLLWGRQDIVVPLSIGQRLSRTLPDAELVVLDRCGHVVPEERPRASLAAMRQWLSRHPLPATPPLRSPR
ncbi:MAG: alpha/beta hydrolase [Gemmatimonadota bacterium]